MNKEFELQTINQWIVSPSSQESENLASKSHETRRIPDPYVFRIEDGKIKTPNGILVEKAIARGTVVYEREFEALLKIQEWADKNESGTSLWFSPPYLNGYSCLKIVIGEIMQTDAGEKILFNRAVILDVDSDTSLKIANYLSDENYSDAEELRKKPIFLKKNMEWIDLLGIYTDQAEYIRTSQDMIVKSQTISQINTIYSSYQTRGLNKYQLHRFMEEEARQKGLIGDKADSCAVGGRVSAFGALFNGSLLEGPIDSFPCPRCNGPIPSGLGITVCPHCGLTKEEAGSTCG